MAYEGIPLNSPYFAKLWCEISQAQKTDKDFIQRLCSSSHMVDYMESILHDNRSALNNPHICQFFNTYFKLVSTCLFVSVCYLFAYSLLTVYLLYTYCLLTFYLLFIYYILTFYLLYTYCLLTFYLLYTCCLLIFHLLYTYCLLTFFLLYTYCLLTIYLPFTYHLLTVGTSPGAMWRYNDRECWECRGSSYDHRDITEFTSYSTIS